jgi:hypothetical protein
VASEHRLLEPARAGTPPAFLALPGLRTLASRPFRIVLALILWAIGAAFLILFLVRQANQPDGQFGFDFAAYQAATLNLQQHGTPYLAGMLDGPIDAQGALLYKYPPPFAQLLVPLAGLPTATGNAFWAALQAVMVFGAVWLGGTFGGARASFERFLWTGVAVTFFLPVLDTLWKGNVTGLQVLLTAVAAGPGLVGGAGVAATILCKTTPATALPAIAAARRRTQLGFLVAGTAATAASFLVSPTAWVEFVRVVPNLLGGGWVFAGNLAPASFIATAAPDATLLVTVVRLATIALGALCVAASVVAVRRPGGWGAAVTLATAAMLLIPYAAWYHYLAVLLPLAAMAWPRGSARVRAALVAGGATVVVGLAFLPLATLGAAVLVGGIVAALWPRRSPDATDRAASERGTVRAAGSSGGTP